MFSTFFFLSFADNQIYNEKLFEWEQYRDMISKYDPWQKKGAGI